jgi:hypothetical protein
MCGGCPVLADCAPAADETRETWGALAGLDRTRKGRHG